jgi:hypothetical protein
VEFAPNLYPLIAEKMGDRINLLKAEASLAKQVNSHE